jgi:two-component system, sensor histidine kinase RegB
VGRWQEDAAFEDIALIAAQSDRCRDILQQLSRDVSADHQMPFRDQPLSSLIEFAAAPHKRAKINLDIRTVGVKEPRVQMTPDILHGLGNILQNGIQFAKSAVTVTVSSTPDDVSVLIRDDGPGYPIQEIDRLGEPYHTSRIDDEGGSHLGLGLFIAQTLLLQKGASLEFYNDGGACCLIKWERKDLQGVQSHDSHAA